MNMSYNQLFEKKVVLITGAASGIGAAAARVFAEAGAAVVLADIQSEAGEVLAKSLKAEGKKAYFIKTDVRIESDIQEMVNATIQKFGRLDCAFNDAGIEGDVASLTECTNENWDRILMINLKSVWWSMKYEIPEMIKVGGGSIVNCASIAGVVGFAGIPAYVASKHAVVGLTKNAAIDYASQMIRVNSICPGVIQTPMIDRFTGGKADALSGLKQGSPMGRLGTPNEIAEAALWLCSDQSSFVTGHALVADGGWVAK